MEQVYTNSCVRDLAWALASPPLMQPSGVECEWYDYAWYQQIYADSINWLAELDRQPEELLNLLESEKDKRLGKYFENLWAYYFQCSNRYSVLLKNSQILHQQKTLGELDFIVRENATEQVIHIEMAIKFYLGVDATSKASNWHGPGKQDRLDRKMHSLLYKQSVFSRHHVVSEQLNQIGIVVDRCAVIMKGRFFYPPGQHVDRIMPGQSHPEHLHSCWYRYSDFSFKAGCSYMPLIRSGWMAGQKLDDSECLQTRSELEIRLAAGDLRLPLQLVAYQDNIEIERFFVVPDEWTNGI